MINRRKFLGGLLASPLLVFFKPKKELENPNTYKQLIGCHLKEDGIPIYTYADNTFVDCRGVIFDDKTKTWKTINFREEIL